MERQSEESFCWVGLITVGATCIYLGERRGGGGGGCGERQRRCSVGSIGGRVRVGRKVKLGYPGE